MNSWNFEQAVVSCLFGVVALTTGYLSVLCVRGLGGGLLSGKDLPAPKLMGMLPALGLVAAMTPSPARERLRVAPPRTSLSQEPPWSGASGLPPPRPLARIRASRSNQGGVHPGVHGRRSAHEGAQALFERAGSASSRPGSSGGDRGARTHDRLSNDPPSGLDSFGERLVGHSDDATQAVYVVRPGDKLWSIAAEALGTQDPARVARYWPRIHRANRILIGPNPDLIYPGQMLRLPEEPQAPH